MSIRITHKLCCAVLGCWWLTGLTQADEGPPAPTVQPAIEELADGRYRIGSIVVDKRERSFQVPGEVIELQNEFSPVEFIAVTRGGYKRYEAVFELDATGVEFNLACILIGLDNTGVVQPKRHFDPEPLEGDRVDIRVGWKQEGGFHEVPVGKVLRREKEQDGRDEWIYTGSYFGVQGNYMPDTVGTLIGFVHDPESVIQHRTGLGLNDYGAITFNREVLPAPGTSVTLTVEAEDEYDQDDPHSSAMN